AISATIRCRSREVGADPRSSATIRDRTREVIDDLPSSATRRGPILPLGPSARPLRRKERKEGVLLLNSPGCRRPGEFGDDSWLKSWGRPRPAEFGDGTRPN